MTLQTVVFRADASIDIGTGHVMRCLTLAAALRDVGAQCVFVSRDHPGNLVELIREHGFEAIALPRSDTEPSLLDDEGLPEHSHWLGTTWQADARETLGVLAERRFDWLVVDHYALDVRWESELRQTCERLMVIDDLADRPHDCDLLLDQNIGRQGSDYEGLVPPAACLLLGPRYALLRPEFAALRDSALGRRVPGPIGQIFVSMGGVDKYNLTRRVIDELKVFDFPTGCRLLIIMGRDAPRLQEIREAAVQMPVPTDVQNEVANMAQLMLDSDLAVGAAGGTALEQCCMGLPSIFIIAAENQRRGARALRLSGSALVIDKAEEITRELPRAVTKMLDNKQRHEFSQKCQSVTDGKGCQRTVEKMMGSHGRP